MLEIIIFIGIILLALLGLPLFIVMALSALTAFTFADTEISAVASEMYRISSFSTLLSIPLFTLAGYLMAESGTPKRIIRFTEMALGWMPGGVAMVVLIVCAIFTAFTGASGVTIIALGGLVLSILTNEGYDEKFSLGLITSAGSIGLLFPPSLPLIVYGLVGKVDIDHLFRAGIIPGMILISIFCFWAMIHGPKKEKKAGKQFSWAELWAGFKGSFFELMLPFLIFGGIYGGFTTVSEAATLTALYVLIMECLIYRDIHIARDLPRLIGESMTLVGAILMILTCALGVTNYLVDQDVPTYMLGFMRQFLSSKYSFLFFLNIFLLAVGCIMDIFSAIVVVVPLIIPIAKEFGVDPVHLAVIFITNLEIGYLTPLVGINLFVGSMRFKKPVLTLYKSVFPFQLLMIVALMIITYIPYLSLVLIKK